MDRVQESVKCSANCNYFLLRKMCTQKGDKKIELCLWLKMTFFFKYSFPQCKRNILEYETRTFFIVFFVCICSKCSMYYTHSGPTIPFEDGELPQDTCRARGKADIRYSMDYHFEIRYSKDYHVETYCRWTWRLSWFQLAIQIWSWNGSSGKKGNTGPIYSAFLVKYKLFID